MASEKCILVIATLDTKSAATFYLRDRIRELGQKPIIMDLSMGSKWEANAAIPPEQVANAGGSNLSQIHQSKNRNNNTEVMTKGAIKIARRLVEEDKIHGVVGIGGSTGSLMATDVMRALPLD